MAWAGKKKVKAVKVVVVHGSVSSRDLIFAAQSFTGTYLSAAIAFWNSIAL